MHTIQCLIKFLPVLPTQHLQKLLRKIQPSAELLVVEVVDRESIQVSFPCPRLIIRAAFIFFWPMYLVAVLSQYLFYIFEFQSFFAKNRQLKIGLFALKICSIIDVICRSLFRLLCLDECHVVCIVLRLASNSHCSMFAFHVIRPMYPSET